MSYIDQKYIGIVSVRLRNFQNKGNGTSSFTHKCERSDSRKRRGYFLSYKGSTFFRCHNCGVSQNLSSFLKEQDPGLAAEYRMEQFKAGVFGDYKETKEIVVEDKPEAVVDHFEGLKSYKDIAESHPCMTYLTRRLIPRSHIREFFLAPRFYEWAAKIDPIFGKFKEQVPRLVIPYYDEEKTLLGFACRAFGKENPKYILLRTNKAEEFIYGRDRIDESKKIIAVEGQIDSMFPTNAIAVGGANFDGDYMQSIKHNCIIVPDSDWKRNPQVGKQLKKVIDSGFTIAFLPDSLRGKDINDYIKNGMSIPELDSIIHSSQRSGPAAHLEYVLQKRF